MKDYKNLSEMIEEIITTEKKLCNRAYEFFSPLREKYVTKVIYPNIKTKKFLGFTRNVCDGHNTSYETLIINVYCTVDNTIRVTIFSTVEDKSIYIREEFPCSLFEKNNDYTIMHDERIKEFIRKFLAIAIVKPEELKDVGSS